MLWIKDNWWKLGLVLAAIVLSFSIFYKFVLVNKEGKETKETLSQSAVHNSNDLPVIETPVDLPKEVLSNNKNTITKNSVHTSPEENASIKIESCKSKWIESENFPGTSEEFSNIINQVNSITRGMRDRGEYVDGDMATKMVKSMEDSFRRDGYEMCLKN